MVVGVVKVVGVVGVVVKDDKTAATCLFWSTTLWVIDIKWQVGGTCRSCNNFNREFLSCPQHHYMLRYTRNKQMYYLWSRYNGWPVFEQHCPEDTHTPGYWEWHWGSVYDEMGWILTSTWIQCSTHTVLSGESSFVWPGGVLALSQAVILTGTHSSP